MQILCYSLNLARLWPYGMYSVLQDVLAVSMPLKDDSAVKEYLLHPSRRTGLLMSHGAVASSIQGADALEPLMTGRCFVCLHYKLGAGAELQPCLAPGSDAAQGSRCTAHLQQCVLHSTTHKQVLLVCCKAPT